MDRKKIYQNILQKGNKEITYLVTRSMIPIKERERITIDHDRLKNELRLYKYNAEKGSPSVLSALIPVIIANSDFECSFEEAVDIFDKIRKKITLKNKIGINLLCHFLYNLEDFNAKFSGYKMHGASKEEEVAFQKEKISIIMKQRSVFESIVDNLDESEKEKNIDMLKFLGEISEDSKDPMVEKMSAYFDKISRFGIAPKPLKGNLNIQAISLQDVNAIGQDPLLGEYRVLSKDQNQICIHTKRGPITLLIPQEQIAGYNNMGQETLSHKQFEPERDIDVLKRKYAWDRLSEDWKEILNHELKQDYFKVLLQKVDHLYHTGRVFPKQDQVFRCLQEVPYSKVKVVIIGQDPYHGVGQANGLCFSVNNGVKAPPSLMNIFKELEEEYGVKRNKVDLIDWAEQGVLMLNSVLTVQESTPGSHAKMGWERFTDKIIEVLSKRDEPIVFILWGNYAISKANNVDLSRHCVLRSAHPSPLSCKNFFGNQHFLLANKFLTENGKQEIVWV